MKKTIGVLLLTVLCAVILPLNANAASGEIFGSSSETLASGTTTENGNTVRILNRGSNTKIYLGANVTSGKLTEYNVQIKLENSNFTYKSFEKESGWSGTVTANEEGTLINVNLSSTAGLTGRGKVATINLNVSDSAASTETCRITITRVEEEEHETPENPKCQVVDGKYYDANGNEVSEAAYNEACVTAENPQTGSFLPYTIILAGATIALGLYLVTKKNNKIYHV